MSNPYTPPRSKRVDRLSPIGKFSTIDSLPGKIGWRVFFYIYFFVTLMTFGLKLYHYINRATAVDTILMTLLPGFVGAVAVLLGLWGYCQDQPIFRRLFWKILFGMLMMKFLFVNVFCEISKMVQIVDVVALHGSLHLILIDTFVDFGFSFLALWAIYKYAFCASIWNKS